MRKVIAIVISLWVAIGSGSAGAAEKWSKELSAAAAKGERQMLGAALEKGLSVDAADRHGTTLLMVAAQNGQLELAAYLLFNKAQVDQRDKNGRTALMHACLKGDRAMANLLIQAGADVNAEDHSRKKVIRYVQESKYPELVALLISCGARRDKERAEGTDGYHKVAVHYATNRMMIRDQKSGSLSGFANLPDRELHYGMCDVSIPKNHIPGEMESPLPFLPFDPKKHVTLLGITPQEQEAFYRTIREQLKSSGQNDVLVFIHGYNVSFSEAARRTAQLSYDLAFPGAPMFFSWPSTASLLGYGEDQQRIKATVPLLKEYLRRVAAEFKGARINIIAHSMGTFGFTTALKELAEEAAAKNEVLRFNQVILAAPDIDAKVFREEIAPKIGPTAQRVTLYSSSRDLALIISNFVNKGQRAGDSDPEVVLNPGIDSIDVSLIDTSLLGHSYYGSTESVITDIKSVLQDRKPEARQFLEAKEHPLLKRRFWLFRPQAALSGT